MHPYDKMVLLTLLSYALALLGLSVILYWILHNLCNLPHKEARNYAILGIVFITLAIVAYVKKENDKWDIGVQR